MNGEVPETAIREIFTNLLNKDMGNVEIQNWSNLRRDQNCFPLEANNKVKIILLEFQPEFHECYIMKEGSDHQVIGSLIGKINCLKDGEKLTDALQRNKGCDYAFYYDQRTTKEGRIRPFRITDGERE